ncbi:hypothetical protein LGM77_10835 [Burkholderia vietnamiensis]|uniref:hypothetical protein n=1 Tax=Burkholderia cepacia complex TaxID=87882 RepID=UPI001CF16C69|nr:MULTISPECIES: hypothetical protein [Burkholderia cepacia complex]MCA8156197.1 hypothetical protein [Burkholderia contaminans]MCA8207961.1 hypothetical protein [Burkholderia vietnamiensis]
MRPHRDIVRDAPGLEADFMIVRIGAHGQMLGRVLVEEFANGARGRAHIKKAIRDRLPRNRVSCRAGLAGPLGLSQCAPQPLRGQPLNRRLGFGDIS